MGDETEDGKVVLAAAVDVDAAMGALSVEGAAPAEVVEEPPAGSKVSSKLKPEVALDAMPRSA